MVWVVIWKFREGKVITKGQALRFKKGSDSPPFGSASPSVGHLKSLFYRPLLLLGSGHGVLLLPGRSSPSPVFPSPPSVLAGRRYLRCPPPSIHRHQVPSPSLSASCLIDTHFYHLVKRRRATVLRNIM